MEVEAEAVRDEAVTRVRRRRGWVWLCVAAGALLLLLLTPPLVNVNRLQRRVAANMSATLGRPVHLDRVKLHMLPVPGLTFENLVVSEDPAFGVEPVIRANVVEATLRPGSLWRRQVEFSSLRFVEPSLNLVRNAEGRWNLESLLMHAAEVSAAPTEQRKAGPTPRFPYIEATGGRVNLKLGEEKQPFSLTEADFALWLPTPEQWQVRIEGKPARTDRNVSDTGTVRLEGGLGRASRPGEVPVDLRASWHDAPMGEASKLLTGEDMEWRGRLTVEAALAGKLGAAKLTAQIHLNDLRRADFVPAKLLNVDVECAATLEVETAVTTLPECSAETPAAAGAKEAGRISGVADSIDLTTLRAKDLRVGMTGVPDAWLLNWARLFSQRIPENESPQGTAGGTVLWVPGTGGRPGSWQGSFHAAVMAAWPWEPAAEKATLHPVDLDFETEGLVLHGMPLVQDGESAELVLSGTATRSGYSLRLVGPATAPQLTTLRGLLPPLGDGMDAALPAGEATGKAVKLDMTCTRPWGGAQTCVEAAVKRRR